MVFMKDINYQSSLKMCYEKEEEEEIASLVNSTKHLRNKS